MLARYTIKHALPPAVLYEHTWPEDGSHLLAVWTGRPLRLSEQAEMVSRYLQGGQYTNAEQFARIPFALMVLGTLLHAGYQLVNIFVTPSSMALWARVRSSHQGAAG